MRSSNSAHAGPGQVREHLPIAGDIRLVFIKMHGSIDEAKVDVSVEHVEVDGGASINDGRHHLQNLCRTRENSDNGMRQSPRRTPNLSFSCLSWALAGVSFTALLFRHRGSRLQWK